MSEFYYPGDVRVAAAALAAQAANLGRQLPVLVRFRVRRPDDISPRYWRRELLPKANAAMAMHWHKYMLPERFEPGGGRRYGFQHRSSKYLRRKDKLHALGQIEGTSKTDLVYSGATRQRAMHVYRIKAYPSRATVEMKVPAYITINPFVFRRDKTGIGTNNTRPNLAAELATVLPEQVDELADRADLQLQGLLAQIRAAGGVRKYNRTLKP